MEKSEKGKSMKAYANDADVTAKESGKGIRTISKESEKDAPESVKESGKDAPESVKESGKDAPVIGKESGKDAPDNAKESGKSASEIEQESGKDAAEAVAKAPERGKRTLWTLFKTCFVISSCTFGGGMVIISLLQKKFVEELRWIGQDEVMDMVAIAQSCPGVMAVNTSIIIGYRIAGVPGALLTVIGTVLPPMIILTIVSACYVQFRSNTVIALLLKGMQAGVAAVMLNVSISMVKSVAKEHSALAYVMLAGAVIAVMVFGIDIILVLICCGALGGAAVCLRRNADRK